MRIRFILSFILTTFSNQIIATENNWYLSLSGGQTDLSEIIEEGDVSGVWALYFYGNFCCNLVLQSFNEEISDSDTGHKLTLGMPLENSTLEFSLINLGTAEGVHTTTFDENPPTGIIGNSKTTAKVELAGLAISIGKMFKINSSLSLFPKLGLFHWEADAKTSVFIVTPDGQQVNSDDNLSDTGDDLFYGVSLNYLIDGHWFIEAGFDRFDIDGYNVDFTFFTIGHHFTN